MADDTADVLREEAARQAVILAFGVAGMVLVIWAQRRAADPDAARTLRMRAAKGGERFLARLAAWSWGQAERARRAYEQDAA
jgi:hypothetical protein